MKTSKTALIYFTVSMKITWVLMVLFYSPALLIFCLLMNGLGLLYFFKNSLSPLLTIALIGFSFDCFWHSLGIISFANVSGLPLWLMPLWLSYSVYIVYFFNRFLQYAYIIPVVFPLLTLSSYSIGVSLGNSEIHSIAYYVATLLGWATMAYLILNRQIAQQRTKVY